MGGRPGRGGRLEPAPDPARSGAESLAWLGIGLLAVLLLLPNLGEPNLWQDEAQTALIARTIPHHGVPLGSDGRNQFSQELGREYGPGAVWKWHTWLSFYAVAASFACFGESTASARLPFALFGVATVLLAGATGRRLWGDPRPAAAGALLLALSVPFLILSRQCRYYAMASFFSLLGLFAYARLGTSRRAGWLLFAAAFLLFHTHYVYVATLLASLLLHAFVCERPRLAPTLRVTAAVALVNLPWIVWFADVRPGGSGYWASVLDPGKALAYAAEYTRLALGTLFPAWLLLGVPLLLGLRRLRGERGLQPPPRVRSGLALLGIYCAVSVLVLSVLSPLLFYRYLAPLAPPLALLAGLLLAALARSSRLLAAGCVALFALGGGLRGYLYELGHRLDGPLEVLADYLNEHARPGDVLAISYGDLPLKFYTPLRVLGGLTGEDLTPARQADWIVPRRHVNTEEDRRVRRELLEIVRGGDYELLLLDVPDVAFENREDPRLHHFGPTRPQAGPLRLFRRRR
jgi:4-amino-4-deoxy-L-arabinose transferase-like glycosyltransferase